MKPPYKAAFVTVVPSPYQRDLFSALAARGDVELSVYYMEAETPENPWPKASLEPFEHILPGRCTVIEGARFQVNWSLPDLSRQDFVILSTYTSLTGQWLMRRTLTRSRWLYWGERMRGQARGWKAAIQARLAAPLARASGIVGIGREAEADYRRRFPHVPQFCIPYHCDLEPFLRAPRRNEPGQPLRFFFCGQMIARKGVDLLLAAFDGLVKKGYDAELLLVGREAELPAFIAAIGPETRARVHYEGFQAPDKLAGYFSQSDVFVLPSRYDGWGVVVNQALGAGLPVIATDAVGAGLDLVEPNVNGLLCRAGDAVSLQAAMERLAGRRDLVFVWGNASRKLAATITPEAGAEKWFQVFDNLAPVPLGKAACIPVLPKPETAPSTAPKS